VDGATSGGATVVTGGGAPDRRGYFYTPTLLDDVPAGAAILNSEIFGPVAPVVRFTDEADAIRWANATEFGLVSYVYTQDLRRGLRVSEALEAGHDRPQPRDRVRPGGAVRRGQAVWPRPRGRPRGAPRVHGDQVHRNRLVM